MWFSGWKKGSVFSISFLYVSRVQRALGTAKFTVRAYLEEGGRNEKRRRRQQTRRTYSCVPLDSIRDCFWRFSFCFQVADGKWKALKKVFKSIDEKLFSDVAKLIQLKPAASVKKKKKCVA